MVAQVLKRVPSVFCFLSACCTMDVAKAETEKRKYTITSSDSTPGSAARSSQSCWARSACMRCRPSSSLLTIITCGRGEASLMTAATWLMKTVLGYRCGSWSGCK